MTRHTRPTLLDRIPPEVRPWHALNALSACVVVGYLAVQPPAVALWWLPAGLFVTWVIAGVLLPPRLAGPTWGVVGALYFLAGAALFVLLVRTDPVAYVMLFALYPALFNRMALGMAIPFALLIGTATVLAEAFGTQGPRPPALLLGGALGAVGASLLGVFIHRLSTINEERHRLIHELQDTRDELAAAEREAGMLAERQRLAREIHDTLAQGFTSIVTHLEAAEGVLGDNALPDAAKAHFDRARQTARDSLTEARRMVSALRPDLLENASSLESAIRRLARRWSAGSGVAATVNATGARTPLPVEAEVALLRAAQEALANVQKHAGASEVVITLSYLSDGVMLDIYDDGRGFDPAAVVTHAHGGFGLHGIRERIEALEGTFFIESEPGEGTTVAVSVPLPGERSEA